MKTEFIVALARRLNVPMAYFTDPKATLPEPPRQGPGEPINLDAVRAVLSAIRMASDDSRSSKPQKLVRKIPVVGEVAAGVWREALPFELSDVTEWLDMNVDGYGRARLSAMRVVGPSMNEVYPEGRYVVLAHPAEAGLREGDIVAVERTRADLIEITLKEFTTKPGQLVLRPRSSHPDFQDPIVVDLMWAPRSS